MNAASLKRTNPHAHLQILASTPDFVCRMSLQLDEMNIPSLKAKPFYIFIQIHHLLTADNRQWCEMKERIRMRFLYISEIVSVSMSFKVSEKNLFETDTCLGDPVRPN